VIFKYQVLKTNSTSFSLIASINCCCYQCSENNRLPEQWIESYLPENSGAFACFWVGRSVQSL